MHLIGHTLQFETLNYSYMFTEKELKHFGSMVPGACSRELVKSVRRLGEDDREEVKTREKRKRALCFLLESFGLRLFIEDRQR